MQNGRVAIFCGWGLDVGNIVHYVMGIAKEDDMNASTMSADRLVQFHADGLAFDGARALQRRVAAFVRGVRGKRSAPVTEAQIVAYFRATDADFVRAAITDAVACGDIRIVRRSLSSGRRANGGYSYEAVEAGTCPRCGEESLPFSHTGETSALCDDCLGDHLDLTE